MESRKLTAYLPPFFYSQLFVRIPYPRASFAGQTIIVSGSNTGLGLEAARHFARLGAAKIILAVRTVAKGEAAAENIVKTTKLPKNVVEVWQLDMSDIESVKAFAKHAEDLERLDAVILNAGMLTENFDNTHNSLKIESTVAVNVVATMLLSSLLLPILRRSAATTGRQGRLAVVGSDMMYNANPAELEPGNGGTILEHLSDSQTSSMSSRYALSKLLVFWSLQHLARLSPISQKSDVIITALTPGFCHSGLLRENSSIAFRFAVGAVKALIARTTETGSRTLVYGAAEDLPVKAHGKFIMDNRVVTKQWENVENPQLKSLEDKWNREVFQMLESLSSGCVQHI